MAKKYPMDLTKHNKLKKKSYLTLNQIEQNLKNNGYDEDSINLMKNKIEIRKEFTFNNIHIVRNCTSERCKKSAHAHTYHVEVFLTSNKLDNGQLELVVRILNK